MKLPSWLSVRDSRRVGPRTVVVTLTADTSQFLDAMGKLGDQTREAASVQTYRHRIRMERLAGLAFVNQALDQMARDVGIAGRGHCGQERQCSATAACACGHEVQAELVAGDSR